MPVLCVFLRFENNLRAAISKQIRLLLLLEDVPMQTVLENNY